MMAKQKKQKRKIIQHPVADAVASAGAEQGRDKGYIKSGVDAKKLSMILLILSCIIIPVAVLMKTKIDAMTDEVLGTNYDTGVLTASNTVERTTPQKKTVVDPSKFKNSWDMTMHFSKGYDSKGLHTQLTKLFEFNERAYDPSTRRRPLQPAYKERGAGFDRTTRHKLVHDLEQFDYFLRCDQVGKKSHGLELFRSTIPKLYRATLNRLDQAAKQGLFNEETEFYSFQKEDSQIMNYYNRAIFLPTLPLVKGPLLVPRDWAQVEREWLGEDVTHNANPGIVVVDNLLSPQTLKRVQDYLLLSTFWYEAKLPRYGHYLGAYLNDGMYDSMMTEIAFELHKVMPRVMNNHHLKEMWSYKYESSFHDDEERMGIHVHADDAMVNVNLWITPDEANLDPNSGGLVIYTVKPPREWSFSNFNSNWEYIDQHLLRPSGYANVTIPYKQNRVVIFDSFLFHKSDKIKFKQGYENRRMNLTFLYGKKQSIETSEGSSTSNMERKNEM